jgi:Sjoegren syndrome nuclear autoantigen 1
MAAHGAALQNHNNELVKCLEDLRDKREEIGKQITREEEEKSKIQNDLTVLTKRLAQINDSIARKVASRNDYDKTIQETEAAYLKVCFSSWCRSCTVHNFVSFYDGSPKNIRSWLLYLARTDSGELPDVAHGAET